MTTISTVHAAFLTKLSTLYPNHKRIVNPYRIEANIEPWLSQGYGVAMRDGNNTQRNVSKRMSVGRNFGIIFSRKFYGRDLDASVRSSAELQLFEDQYSLIQDLESDPTLGGAAARIVFESDSGIQFVNADSDNFLFVETTFLVEYFENLT